MPASEVDIFQRSTGDCSDNRRGGVLVDTRLLDLAEELGIIVEVVLCIFALNLDNLPWLQGFRCIGMVHEVGQVKVLGRRP